jgi:hypothetical protein
LTILSHSCILLKYDMGYCGYNFQPQTVDVVHRVEDQPSRFVSCTLLEYHTVRCKGFQTSRTEDFHYLNALVCPLLRRRITVYLTYFFIEVISFDVIHVDAFSSAEYSYLSKTGQNSALSLNCTFRINSIVCCWCWCCWCWCWCCCSF